MDTPDLNQPDDQTSTGNPYAPTREIQSRLIVGGIELPAGMSRVKFGQITVVGILMMIQGVLNMVAALFIGFYAWILPEIFRQTPNGQGVPAEALLIMGVITGGVAAFVFSIGVFNVWAGWWTVHYKNRGRAIIALWSGLGSLFTCYCLPTSIILLIYGLVILMSPTANLAFDLRKRGHAGDDIHRAFQSLPQ
ncbi:MAG: hypothetical protein AAF989_16055 [Planctomycetota bacterium]